MSLSAYKTTWCHSQEDQNLNSHHYGNLKITKLLKLTVPIGFSVNSIRYSVSRVKSFKSFIFFVFLNMGSLSTSSHLLARKMDEDCKNNFKVTTAQTNIVNINHLKCHTMCEIIFSQGLTTLHNPITLHVYRITSLLQFLKMFFLFWYQLY
jgi:hypothetical protein